MWKEANLVMSICLLLCMAACSSHVVLDPFGAEGASWPPISSNVQRIAFVGDFSHPSDFGISEGFLARFLAFSAGSSDNSMKRPMAVVTTEDNGVVFVADPDARCVHRYDMVASRYDCMAPRDDSLTVFPIGVAVSDDGWLYVADSKNAQLFRSKPGGAKLDLFYTGADLRQPTGISWDSKSQRLFVTDTGSQMIFVFDRDGNLKKTMGQRGSANGEFNFPTYLWSTVEGNLLVTDSLNFRVQQFDADGVFLQAFGKNGDKPGDFSRPKGIAVDSLGHIYVIDALMHAMQVFSTRGELLLTIGGRGQGEGRFWLPNGIFVTSDDLIFVADSYNQRVQVFRYVGSGS